MTSVSSDFYPNGDNEYGHPNDDDAFSTLRDRYAYTLSVLAPKIAQFRELYNNAQKQHEASQQVIQKYEAAVELLKTEVTYES